MKALSIRQPWAELILQDRKTIELRTWTTNYRGRLAVHAAQTVEEADCRAYGLDPTTLPRGVLVGTVEVVEMTPLDEALWEALRDQHLGQGPFPGPLYGWRLADPQRLPQPIPLPGRMGLFNVPDELLASGSPASAPLPAVRPRPTYRVEAEPGYDPEKPFELRVVLHKGNGYGLALYQWPVAANTGQPADAISARPQCLVELAGDPLRAVADHVLEALRRAGYKATDLSRERREPFRLDEETGLRLGLLFLTVKPLTRMNRIEAISSALRIMPSEEAYYWFSKCTAAQSAVNAQRALRILLAGE
jgi:hypothetical protein